MTLTVELTPTQEAKLRADAAQEGVDQATLLLTRAGLLEPSATQAEVGTPSAALRQEGFAEWQARWEASLPLSLPVSDEDISREAMYARDDDATFHPQKGV